MALWLRTPAMGQAAAPAFEVEPVATPDRSVTGITVDIYARVPYSSLQFISQAGGFVAEYGVVSELYAVDADGRQQGIVISRIWERVVPPVPTYDATQSDTLYDLTTHRIEGLSPGRFVLEVQVEDKYSSASFLLKKEMTVRPFEGRVAVSDLLIADAYDAETNRLTPNVANVIESDADDFTVFFQIASRESASVQVSYVVQQRRKKRKSARRGDRPETEPGDIVFETVDRIPLRVGLNPAALRVPLANLSVGNYTVTVRVRDENAALLDSADKDLTVMWAGLADQLSDLSKAVDQLTYIAKGKELAWIREADSDEERVQRFNLFWKKRDPTPITARNERMEEYYYRISHANNQYGGFSHGWQTDRGQVYVLYGEPDYISRHTYAFGSSRPYEVWTYNSFGRQFVFVDRTGVGDYELLVPIWDERTRIR